MGRLLGRHWELKRGLGARVSLPRADRAYEDALAAGATGANCSGRVGAGTCSCTFPSIDSLTCAKS
ncbi:hypothetical protein HEP87_61005 [Streptomyces sp. S1D4-11]